ncbi:efflux transporter outer membrane subunit [Sphingomonas fennica]|uniref:efflux transporter outer membrane subunit n=1 Tax=Edaphosphingomonas fennica TaxID=114404 RepID=UPI0014732087|nr:efflux transporter outer membrane subunit [Sphingomonas fennica]
MALASCAPRLGPSPTIASVTQFETSASLPGGDQQWPKTDWWRDFGDPQLDQLIAEGIANSPLMAEAEARVALARAQAISARAALLPRVDTLGAVQDTRISQNIELPTSGGWSWLGSALLSGSFEIDFWGKNRAALRVATSQTRAAQADIAAARLMLTVQIASAYADFARLEANRSLAAAALRTRTEARDLVAVRIRAGTAPAQAMDQAESGVQSATAQLRSVDEAIMLVRHMIAALAGSGPDRGDRIASPALIHRRSPDLPNDLPLELVGRKPELVAARWRAEAAAQQIHEARTAYYPNVNLLGVFGVVSLGLDRLFTDGSQLGTVGPAVSVPVFEGGRLAAGYRGARAEYDLAVASYREVLLQSLKDAADAVTSLKALPNEAQAADAAEAKAQNAYALTKLRYEGGLADFDAVLISENALIAARDEATMLRLRGFQLDITLARALGGGFSGRAPTRRTTS